MGGFLPNATRMFILANFGKNGYPKNGKRPFLIIKSCLVLKNSNINQFLWLSVNYLKKVDLAIFFCKNGYPQKCQNVIFDDDIMFSVEKQQ